MAETTAIAKKDIIDNLDARIQQLLSTGALQFPKNYSYHNALLSAWLIIQDVVDREKRPALSVCTKESVYNALLGMAIMGLNPDKKQCYFIVYGSKLALQRSYFGSIAVAKRVDENVEDVFPGVIYEGDVFEFEKCRGRDIVVKHVQKFENINKAKIKGAYATVFYKDGTEAATIMTLADIYQAWRQSKANPFDDKGNLKPDSTHAKFTADMAMKTVVNKACKPIINSSDDRNLVAQYARMTEDDMVEAEVFEEIAENANSEVIDVEYDVDPDTGEVAGSADAQKGDTAAVPAPHEEPDGQTSLEGAPPPKQTATKSAGKKTGDPY
jgi:Recombinational DNA repair protein (RecE pathway)